MFNTLWLFSMTHVEKLFVNEYNHNSNKKQPLFQETSTTIKCVVGGFLFSIFFFYSMYKLWIKNTTTSDAATCLNCSDFIQQHECKYYKFFTEAYLIVTTKHVRDCLRYVYSLTCSVRKTEMKHTSFKEYYSHSYTDIFFIHFIWSYVERLWARKRQQKRIDQRKPCVKQWSIWKKDAIFALKNTALTKQRLCNTTAPLLKGGRREKNSFVHCCLMLPRVTARWCPACCSWSPTVFHPSCRQRPSSSNSQGHSRWAHKHTEGHTMVVTCCVAFEQRFGKTKIRQF